MLTRGFRRNELLPFQSHYLTVAGHAMHYLDEGARAGHYLDEGARDGDRPVVVLMHGNPTWCFYYRDLIRALSDSFRVIVPDFLGMGLSDKPKNVHFRAADRANHLEELLAALGIQRFSLVMHDWGGPIASSMAVRHPERVVSLVYLNTTLTETEALPSMIKLAAKPGIGRFLTRTTNRFIKMTTSFGVYHPLKPEIRAGYLYPYRSAADRSAIWDFVSDIPFDSNHPTYALMLSLGQGLPKLSHVPVKIIWGLRDPCFHREMLSNVARHFPQAEVVEIPEASHLVLEDAPEIVIPGIREFLFRSTGLTAKTTAPGDAPAAPFPSSEPHETNAAGQAELRVNPLVKAFLQRVAEIPRQDAVIEARFVGDAARYTHHHYGSFASLVNRYRRGLCDLGLAAEDRVLFLVPPGADFLALSFAVMSAGAVPVYVDPGAGTENLLRCIADCQANVFIGSPKAQLLRFLHRSLFKGIKFHLTVHDWSVTGGPNLSYLKRFSSSPQTPPVPTAEEALIAFTSGATGTPKGVIYTHTMIAQQLEILEHQFGLTKGERDCPLLGVFSLFTLALGVTVAFPPIDQSQPLTLDPAKIVKMVQELNLTSSFGSPTLWRKIAEFCVRSGVKLDGMRHIFMAGAPVSRETLQLVAQVIPNGHASTPYGATEALPVTLIDDVALGAHSEEPAVTGEQGVYVGRPVQGVTVRVIPISHDALPSLAETSRCAPYEIGEIIVCGENVSPRYLHRLDANKFGKIPDGETFWHRMGDVGYLDREGGLYLCGRKAHMVSPAPDTHYFSLPVERLFNAHPHVKRSALVDLKGAVRNGELPVGIAIEPDAVALGAGKDGIKDLKKELRAIAATHSLSKGIEQFFVFEQFPVDGRHNAKIFRDRLGEWSREILSGKRKEI